MNNPLVSIAVITYNSAKTVIETLESIKAQTYRNIELIISDDCSTDNTVELCHRWTEQNKDSFVRTEILTTEKNTGVTCNENRAWNAAQSDFLKPIAGDDILLPECIKDNMAYMQKHPNAVLVFSKPQVIGLSTKKAKLYEAGFDYSFFEMSSKEQYERIKYSNCIPSCTMFLNLKKIREIGLFLDERIPMMEDRVLFINATLLNVPFDFFAKYTVKYRVRENSLANASLAHPLYYKSRRLYYFYYIFLPEYDKDKSKAIENFADNEMEEYNYYYGKILQYGDFSNTIVYKLWKYCHNPRLIIKRVQKLFS